MKAIIQPGDRKTILGSVHNLIRFCRFRKQEAFLKSWQYYINFRKVYPNQTYLGIKFDDLNLLTK